MDKALPFAMKEDIKSSILEAVITPPQTIIISDKASHSYSTPVTQTEILSLEIDTAKSIGDTLHFMNDYKFNQEGIYTVQYVMNPGLGNQQVSSPIEIQVGKSESGVEYIIGEVDSATCKLIDTADKETNQEDKEDEDQADKETPTDTIDTNHELYQKSFDIGWYFWRTPKNNFYLAQGRDDNIHIWQFITKTKEWVPTHNASFGDKKVGSIFNRVFISQDAKQISIGKEETDTNSELQNQVYEIGWYFWKTPSNNFYLAQGRDSNIKVWQFMTKSKEWVPVHNASFGGKSVGKVFSGVSISGDGDGISFF